MSKKEKKLTGNFIEDHKNLWKRRKEEIGKEKTNPNYHRKQARRDIGSFILMVFLSLGSLITGFWPLLLLTIPIGFIKLVYCLDHWAKSADEPKKLMVIM